jgi:hypothetical protein
MPRLPISKDLADLLLLLVLRPQCRRFLSPNPGFHLAVSPDLRPADTLCRCHVDCAVFVVSRWRSAGLSPSSLKYAGSFASGDSDHALAVLALTSHSRDWTE